jgi:tetratricopeptide (TPR) repeat protein
VTRREWRRALAAAGALALAVTVLYWPATGFEFLAYDDSLYVTGNALVQDGLTLRSIVRALTDTSRGLWIPLTWVSYMADGEFFGASAAACHRTNVLLFAASMGLLPLVLWRMTGALGRSVAAAALVALHPLRVESVAWVAERKDVLAVLFLLLALACHIRWVRSRRPAWYLALAVACALGLMSKPSLVVLPALLLVVDYFPLGRFAAAGGQRGPWRGALVEKLPLVGMSLAVAGVTLRILQTGPLPLPWLQRLELAAAAPWIYVGKTLWPARLAVAHFSPGAPRPLLGLAAVAALLAVTGCALRVRRTRPSLAAGWLWYLIAIFPVGGVLPTGLHWIADRFTFLPHIGLAVGALWGVPRRLPAVGRSVVALACVAGCLALAAATRVQLASWRTTETLFRRSIAVCERDYLSWAALAGALVREGRYEEALTCYEQAVRLNPRRWASQFGLLRTLLTLGRRDEARARLRDATAADPANADALLALGAMLLEDGEAKEALGALERALSLTLDEPSRERANRLRERAAAP